MHRIYKTRFHKKHLDFYYRDVLKQNQKEAEADEVLVNVNLAAGVDRFYLKKESVLDGGKNSNNQPLYYNTSSSVRLTSAKIIKIKTLFKKFR